MKCFQVRPFTVSKTWRRGEVRSIRGKINEDSGANFLASDADFDAYAEQVIDATNFRKRPALPSC